MRPNLGTTGSDLGERSSQTLDPMFPNIGTTDSQFKEVRVLNAANFGTTCSRLMTSWFASARTNPSQRWNRGFLTRKIDAPHAGTNFPPRSDLFWVLNSGNKWVKTLEVMLPNLETAGSHFQEVAVFVSSFGKLSLPNVVTHL